MILLSLLIGNSSVADFSLKWIQTNEQFNEHFFMINTSFHDFVVTQYSILVIILNCLRFEMLAMRGALSTSNHKTNKAQTS